MPRLADQSVSTFLAALSAPEPTPGGGTASAIAGAMGVALLMMVAGLPLTLKIGFLAGAVGLSIGAVLGLSAGYLGAPSNR